MKIKNLKITSKALVLGAATSFAMYMFVGCTTTTNTIYAYEDSSLLGESSEIHSLDNNNYKAILFEENTATVLEITAWKRVDDNFIKIQTLDGMIYLAHWKQICILNDSNTDSNIEEIIKNRKGDEIEIKYGSDSLKRNTK